MVQENIAIELTSPKIEKKMPEQPCDESSKKLRDKAMWRCCMLRKFVLQS